jgi:NRAMP (natural resistance-associated macrophage protein)-like metal ion transporter
MRFNYGVALPFAGAAQTRGPFHLTMDVNDRIKTARAFSDAVIVPVHTDGWAHFHQSASDLRTSFNTLGFGARQRTLEPGVVYRHRTVVSCLTECLACERGLSQVLCPEPNSPEFVVAAVGHGMAQRKRSARNHDRSGESPAGKIQSKRPLNPTLALKSLGPGLITGAADDDPSGIGTYSQAGAQLGYGIGWTMLLTFPLMAAIQEISARVGRVTGHGVAGNVCRHYPGWLLSIVVTLLFIANTINIAADLAAMADAAKLLIGGHAILYVLLFGVTSVLAQILMDYKRYVSVLKWLTLSLFAYVAALAFAHVSWGETLTGLLIPRITWSADYFTTIVAILGTTISPYLFFWQASQEAEEQRVDAKKRALIDRHYGAQKEFNRIRADTIVGMAFSNLIALSIIVTAAATLHAAGKIDIQTSAQAAEALRPIAGPLAEMVFALGIIGTGLLAIPVLAGASAYAVGEGRQWPVGLARKPKEAVAFYGVLALSAGFGIALNFTPINPISALYWSAVINGVLAVPVMVLLMLMAGRKAVMDRFAITGPLYWLGWLSTAAMLLSVIAMGAGFFLGAK